MVLMKRIIRILLYLTLALSAAVPSSAKVGIEGFRQMYIVTGIPVDGTSINRNTADVAFQLSFALGLANDMGGVEGLDLKVGYSQKSVWFLYAPSSPFKDNTYIPGIYLAVPTGDKNGNLLCGIEHRSNGRSDKLSRSVNYVFGEFSHSFTSGLTLCANARVGFGWYEDTLTQDIFNKFYGYATLGALYETGRFSALVSVNPTFGPFVLSHTVELAYRPWKSELFNVFIQYHHGYDECLADCVYGQVPGYNLRVGILITPPGVRRLSR